MKLLFTFVVCCSGMVIAQTPATTMQTESHSTVYGQQLGKPLSIPECPAEKISKKIVMYTGDSKVLCFERETETTTVPLNGEKLINGSVWLLAPQGQLLGAINRARIVDGKLDQVSFSMAGAEEQDYIFGILVKKYGDPTTKNINHMENGYGARFDDIEATWSLPDVKVILRGAITMDEGSVTIETPRPDKPQPEPQL
jgi:hypothetical protein